MWAATPAWSARCTATGWVLGCACGMWVLPEPPACLPAARCSPAGLLHSAIVRLPAAPCPAPPLYVAPDRHEEWKEGGHDAGRLRILWVGPAAAHIRRPRRRRIHLVGACRVWWWQRCVCVCWVLADWTAGGCCANSRLLRCLPCSGRGSSAHPAPLPCPAASTSPSCTASLSCPATATTRPRRRRRRAPPSSRAPPPPAVTTACLAAAAGPAARRRGRQSCWLLMPASRSAAWCRPPRPGTLWRMSRPCS